MNIIDEKRILLVSADDATSHSVYHELKKNFNVIGVFVDIPIPRKKFLKNRIRKLGLWKVMGQVLYKLFIAPLVEKAAYKRIQEIVREFGLDVTAFDKEDVLYVGSVNSNRAIDLLKEMNPDLVVVNGTRILSEKVLTAVSADFINTHTGITPLYRGVHGGYWALVNKDVKNAGVTIHFVDKGIDTGSIIAQQKIFPTPKDNIATYPYLQYAAAVPLLHKAIEDYFNGIREKVPIPEGDNHLYYHPTFWEYLFNYLTRHIK